MNYPDATLLSMDIVSSLHCTAPCARPTCTAQHTILSYIYIYIYIFVGHGIRDSVNICLFIRIWAMNKDMGYD